MVSEIRCKRIIDGKTYNTETATLLGIWEPDDTPIEQVLFKTRFGAYFLYIFLETKPDERIDPLEPDKAQAWMETHCRSDLVETEFGKMPDAGSQEARITLRIPETLRKRSIVIAESRNQSLNAWIQRCLEHCASAPDGVR